MATSMLFTGFVFALTFCLGAGSPQYNYRVTGAVPNQSYNTPFVNSQPAGYRPGLLQNPNQRLVPEPTRINSYTGLVEIVPSQPLSQSYLPPSQQNLSPSQNYLPPLPAQQIAPPLASASQNFGNVARLPLQGHNSFTAIPVAPASGGQSLGGQSFGGQSFGGQSFGGQSLGGQSLGGQSLGGQSFGGQSLGGQSLGGQSSNFNQQLALPQQKAIITKDVYIHTAPPDLDDDDREFRNQLESVPIRKNYRIIFIKAPTQNIRVAAQALKQAQAINEERTIIYVLTKKADVADLQKQLQLVQNTQTVNRKPEVFFIKYKTNEEAERAQQEIQAQYDALGGSTNISDEGVAPITSVIGGLLGDKLSASSSGLSRTVAAPSRNYLSPRFASALEQSRSVATPSRAYLPAAKV